MTEDEYIGIPSARILGWQRDFGFTFTASYGTVFRAGLSSADSTSTRLPYTDRDAAIIHHWPDLGHWTSYWAHHSARDRGPMWQALGETELIQANPDGQHVAVLCTLYTGSGTETSCLIMHQHSSVETLYHQLDCFYRCNHPEQTCHTTVNEVHIPPGTPMNLAGGDYLEVFISARPLGPPTIQQKVPEEAAESEAEFEPDQCLEDGKPVIDHGDGKITSDGIHTEDNMGLRSDAMLEEPHFMAQQEIYKAAAISLLQTSKQVIQRRSATIASKSSHSSGSSWSFVYLRPPGNPVNSEPFRLDLDTLDDFDDCLRVVDYRDPEPQHIQSRPPECIDRVWELLTPWPVDRISSDFTEISQIMLPVASAYLDASRPMTDTDETHLSIYVDGSTHIFPDGDLLASYAILPVVTTVDREGQPGYHILGHCGGILSTDPNLPFWTGATTPNSLDAERTGIILAITWLLQSEYWHEVEVDILFDCTSAGYTASGEWSVDRTSLTAQVLRSFGQVIFELCGSRVRFQHVKGHSGDPGNELVDATAKAYAQLLINGSAEQVRINDLVHQIRDDGSWLWLGIVRHLNKGDLPWFSSNAIRLPEGRCTWSTLQSLSFSTNPRMYDQQMPLITLTLASLNIRGLFGRIHADQRHEYSATRGGYVAEQLLWSNYDIVGIQEAYTTDVGVGRFHGYWRIVGGADPKKKAGCELWIAETTTAGPCNPQQFAVLLAEPRCLAVRITLPNIDNIFVVLHAPHNGVSKAEAQSWWTRHQKLTQTWQRLAPIFLLIDANTQLAEPAEERIGDLLSSKASNNAPYFADLCAAADVWLPSTYSYHHQGGTATWRNPAGDWHCIDYVGIPSTISTYHVESWVDQYVDLDAHPEDHRPIGCRLSFTQRPLQTPDHGFRRPNYDIRKLREADLQSAVSSYLEQQPIISWDTDVDSHAVLLRDQIHEALSACLPRTQKQCRQSYISDGTWSLRTTKKDTKAQLNRMETAHNYFWLRCGFNSLAGNWDLDAHLQSCLGSIIHDEIRMAALRRTLRQLTQDVRAGLQTDRDNYSIAVASRCNALPSQDVFRELRALRVGSVFKKKAKRALPNFLQPSGELTTSAQEVAEVWRQHCASLEAGSPIEALALLQESALNDWHRDLSHFDLKGVPSLMTLERHVRRMCPGKAAGVDGIPPDVGRFCPQIISRLLFPLALKQGVLCREPLEFKGGLLAAMYKGKGSQNVPASHRGIMLTSVLGKAVRSSYREQCLPEYYEFTGDQYFSARPAANVGQAGMILRQYCKAVQDVGHSCVVVFLDIQSAYYSVCRELAHGFDGSDESIATLLSRFQLPPAHIHALGARLREGQGSMSSAPLSEFHKQMMVEMMHSTWYTVSGSPVLTRTYGGSRPGDGLADMVFGYIFGELMHHLRRDLSTEGLITSHQWPASFDIKDCLTQGRPSVELPDFLDIIWADDLALAISGPEAKTVWSRAQAMATLLFDWCGRYGLRPNTQRGKTEALVYLRGPGSKQLKIDIFNTAEPAMHLQSTLFPQQKVAVVAQYRHLGGVLHVSGKLLPEVKARIGAAKQTFKLYGRKAFCNPLLHLSHRGRLLQSMVYSILRWNAGSWHLMDTHSWKNFRTAILHLGRRVCQASKAQHDPWHWSDDEVLSTLGILEPAAMLHVLRLSFFTTAFHTAPAMLWILCCRERTWLECLHEAIGWMYSQISYTVTSTDVGAFTQEWLEQVATKGKKWRGWILRAQQHAIRQHQRRFDIERWHGYIYKLLTGFGYQLPELSQQVTEDQRPHPYFCGPCKTLFRTKAAWSVHAFKIHGRIDKLRRYLTGSICFGCGSQYHTTRRLLAHLRYSFYCACRHAHQIGPSAVQPGRNSKNEDLGPQLPVPVLRKYQDTTEDTTGEVSIPDGILPDDTLTIALDEWASEPFEIDDPDAQVHDLRKLVISQIMMPEDMWKSITAFRERAWDAGLYCHTRCLDVVLQNWTVQWLLGEDVAVTVPRLWVVDDKITKAQYRAINSMTGKRLRPPPTQGVHRYPFVEVFLVHFFSGVRRPGDIQSWVEEMRPTTTYLVTVLSVDILYDQRHGDLTDPDIQKRWLDLAMTGAIIASWLGPPCSTWSIARERGLALDDMGPRPVRSTECPYGLSSLSLRELAEVHFGNSLLFFTCAMFAISCLLHRVCMIEHPAIPTWYLRRKTACIWRTGMLKTLLQLPGAMLVEVHQGYYGAAAPKATLLAISHCGDCKQILDDFKCCPLPPPVKMGKTNGSYATAALKEYPSQLAKAMACIGLRWFRTADPARSHAEQLPGRYRQMVEPFCIDFTGLHCIGRDTRGTGPQA